MDPLPPGVVVVGITHNSNVCSKRERCGRDEGSVSLKVTSVQTKLQMAKYHSADKALGRLLKGLGGTAGWLVG